MMRSLIIILLFAAQAANAGYSELKTSQESGIHASSAEVANLESPLIFNDNQKQFLTKMGWYMNTTNPKLSTKFKQASWVAAPMTCLELHLGMLEVYKMRSENIIDAIVEGQLLLEGQALATEANCA